MSEKNKTYRLRTKIGVGVNASMADKYLTVNLNDSFDTIEVLSLKIRQENAYRVHSSQYGVIVGRAVANGGFGVPNVKVSVFIPADQDTLSDPVKNYIYSYTSYTGKNADGIRYNLLPDEKDDDACYQPVGTFPTKRLVLDDDNYLEIFDKYYKYTTKTNASGDYMIFGVPVGSQTIHTDMDLSDVGVLSQRPRDLIYKGYNKNQFESPSKFKADTNLKQLPQIISQDGAVYVYPFWGDSNENIIGITRYDIDIDYKFEPTCVFIGSMVSESPSNAISKKCAPSENMGVMEELVTGEGTIEMIRKTISGAVEEFPIQGNQLVDSHGVWCYQIPMNLDYVMTDEYGNLVPSDDPTKGIPTRTRVRFRMSMKTQSDDTSGTYRGKVLVPNNPDMEGGVVTPDYIFGTLTDESSYRDLLWNNVYTIKSYIPRFQRGVFNSNTNRRFSGIKQCNYYGNNNPIPYNNIRVRLSFQFRLACLITKMLLNIIGIYNKVMGVVSKMLISLGSFDLIANWVREIKILGWRPFKNWHMKPFSALEKAGRSMSCLFMDGSLCEQLDGQWYFAPGCSASENSKEKPIWVNMLNKIEGKKGGDVSYTGQKRKLGDGTDDVFSNDKENQDPSETRTIGGTGGTQYDYIVARGIDYFKQCVEISLAEEYRVIQFDFYNDWINGLLYVPRWERQIKRKRKYFLFGPKITKIRACTDTYSPDFVRFTEQCATAVNISTNALSEKIGCGSNNRYKCHRAKGRKQIKVFKNGALIHEELTLSKKYAYYFKPCDVIDGKKINFFATDLVLLGSLNPYNVSETPLFIDALEQSTYRLPSPLVFTDGDDEGATYELKGDVSKVIAESGYKGIYITDNTAIFPNPKATFTEESGIDWSLSGPGQGNKMITSNYTPGGHFLGISCINAETTTKSCINVRRICEAGVSPSSSYQVPYFGNGTDETIEVVPNGLIAKDEISDGDFRKVFATLNHKKLISSVAANNISKYNLMALYPENFGGEMANYVKNNYNVSLYNNGAITTAGTNSDITEYVNTEVAENPDITNIVRRSLEEKDDDYLKFRYGLDELTQKGLISKFMVSADQGYAVPMFNNSFYFYFGLHNGSTALDQLRNTFLAECEKAVQKTPLKAFLFNTNEVDMFIEPQIIGVFQSGITVTNSYPYFSINSEVYPLTITYRGKQTVIMEDSEDSDREINGVTKVLYKDTAFDENGVIPIGTHTYTITDGDGRTVVKTLIVAREPLSICSSITSCDFTDESWVILKTTPGALLDANYSSRSIYGGYFKVDCSYLYSYTYNGANINVPLNQANIVLVDRKRVIITRSTSTALKNSIKTYFGTGYTYNTSELVR